MAIVERPSQIATIRLNFRLKPTGMPYCMIWPRRPFMAAPRRFAMAYIRRLLIAFGATALASCGHPRADPAVGDCSAIARKYFEDQTLLVTRQQFSSYDLDTQYKIFVCGNQYEIPSFNLQIEFANEGARAVPFLQEKLRQSEVDLTTWDIVGVFSLMSASHQYDVRQDPSVMSLLRDKVRAIHDPNMRSAAQSQLDMISADSP